jgi:hypothetical protein
MNLIAPKFASVAKQKKIGTISARLAAHLLEKGKTMYNEMIDAIKKFTSGHTVEDTVMTLCNIMLDLVELTDEDFAMDVVGVVMGNERFEVE